MHVLSKKRGLTVYELVLFAMLGMVMFVSKIAMEFLPNIHLLGMLTMVYTLTFRVKALIPIYIYVFVNGLYAGFAVWWMPYLYVWTVLWGITLLLPKNMPAWLACVVYPIVCGLHGLMFGLLCAPAQALFFQLNWEMTVAWVMAGFAFDAIHAVGNTLAGLLIVPLVELMTKLMRTVRFDRTSPQK